MNWLLYLCLACTVFDVGVVGMPPPETIELHEQIAAAKIAGLKSECIDAPTTTPNLDSEINFNWRKLMPSMFGDWGGYPDDDSRFETAEQRKRREARAARLKEQASAAQSLPLPLAMEVNAGRMSYERAVDLAKKG